MCHDDKGPKQEAKQRNTTRTPGANSEGVRSNKAQCRNPASSTRLPTWFTGQKDVATLQPVYSLDEWQYSRSFATKLSGTYCNALLFLWPAPLSFDWSPHLRLTCGPAGNRTTTGSLSASSRTTPYQLLHRDAYILQRTAGPSGTMTSCNVLNSSAVCIPYEPAFRTLHCLRQHWYCGNCKDIIDTSVFCMLLSFADTTK